MNQKRDSPTFTSEKKFLRNLTTFQSFYRHECRKFRIVPSNEIIRSIQQSIRLRKLFCRLSLCHHKELSLSHVQVLTRCIHRNSDISEVLLNHNRVLESSISYFMKKLFGNQNITSIELFGNQLTDRICNIFSELLVNNPALRRLKLGDNKITEKGVKKLAEGVKKNSTLIQLHLGGNKIGDKGLEYLAMALYDNSSLTSLGLRVNKIGPTGISFLGKCLMEKGCGLCDIQLKGNLVGKGGAKFLSAAVKINESLKVLELQSNQIESQGVKYLSEGLKANKTIHALNFNNNDLKDKGMEYVSELIKNNKVVTTLGLANNQISKIGIKLFAESLKTSVITGLDLGNNDLSGSGIESLAKIIEKSVSLTSLDLRCCKIYVKGMEILAASLEKNSSVCHLDLGSNFAKNRGAIAWSKVLAVNKSITRLCLTDNQIYQEGGTALAIGLQKNYTLRNFSYGGQGKSANKIDSTIRRIIDEIIKENKRIADKMKANEEQGQPQQINYKSKLKFRFIDIQKQMEAQQKFGKSRSNRKYPLWMLSPIHIVSNPLKKAELDSRLEYIFRSKLLRAENPKFVGFYFIGNVINTLHKVFPDTVDRVDEILVVKHAYEDQKYYVHISRELVKTQIKYVGYEKRASVSTAPFNRVLRNKRNANTPQVQRVFQKRNIKKPQLFTPQPERRDRKQVFGTKKPGRDTIIKNKIKNNQITFSPSIANATPQNTPSSPVDFYEIQREKEPGKRNCWSNTSKSTIFKKKSLNQGWKNEKPHSFPKKKPYAVKPRGWEIQRNNKWENVQQKVPKIQRQLFPPAKEKFSKVRYFDEIKDDDDDDNWEERFFEDTIASPKENDKGEKLIQWKYHTRVKSSPKRIEKDVEKSRGPHKHSNSFSSFFTPPSKKTNQKMLKKIVRPPPKTVQYDKSQNFIREFFLGPKLWEKEIDWSYGDENEDNFEKKNDKW